jgi:uncharacterized protein (TIGR02147 family)
MEKSLPNIFEYIDFRKYLDDYRKARREIDPGFTHAFICHKLGQPNARSYFNNVISGRKNVTAGFIDLFIKLLELGQAEAKFFRALVNYNQATSANEKEYYFDQIVQSNSTPFKLLDKDTYTYYTAWYHSTIRSLLAIIDFKDDYKDLATRLLPPISVTQAKTSIKLLLKLGLIASDSKGYLKPVDKVLSTGEKVADTVLQHYQIRAFELGKDAIANDSCQPKHTLTYTVFVSDTGYKRITGRMEQFQSEIRSIIHKDEEKPNRVYQINLQIIPKSSKLEDK